MLATDISSTILEYALQAARQEGLGNVETRVIDGENLEELEQESFDAVISRVGLIYFPDQRKALVGMLRALKPGGRIASIVYSMAENNEFFSIPVSIIRKRTQLPPTLPGQPGPFSFGGDGALEEAYRVRLGSGKRRPVSFPLRYGCPPPQGAFASGGSHSGRFTR